MPDILVRGISHEALARIDQAAAALGLSRNEYLRRSLDVSHPGPAMPRVTLADLERASEAARDLLDPEVMDDAWR